LPFPNAMSPGNVPAEHQSEKLQTIPEDLQPGGKHNNVGLKNSFFFPKHYLL